MWCQSMHRILSDEMKIERFSRVFIFLFTHLKPTKTKRGYYRVWSESKLFCFLFFLCQRKSTTTKILFLISLRKLFSLKTNFILRVSHSLAASTRIYLYITLEHIEIDLKLSHCLAVCYCCIMVFISESFESKNVVRRQKF